MVRGGYSGTANKAGRLLPASALTPCKEAHQRPRGTSVPSAGVLSPMSPLSFPWKWRPSGESADSPAEEAGKAGRWWEQGPACPGCCCGPLGTLSLTNAGPGTRVSLGKQSQVFPYESNTPHFGDLGKPRNMKDNRNMKRKKENTQFHSSEMPLGTV